MSPARSSALVAAAFYLASCGNSNQDSKANCTPPQAAPLKSIRMPVTSPSTQPNPTAPANSNGTQQPNTAAECAAPPAGQLNAPTQPGAIPAPPPALNGASINGQWSLVSEMCENGMLSERMKSSADMLRSGDFAYQLTINDTRVAESVNVRFKVDNAGTMSCTMNRTSTLEKSGTQLQLKSPASAFTDNGGDIACNLGALQAEVVTIRQIQVQGTSLIIEVPNIEECGGQSKVQIYSGKNL